MKGIDCTIKAVVSLGISAFTVVTTEFIIVGLLPLIASDLAISISTAGLLFTVYAFTVVPSAPLLTTLTAKLERRYLLIGTLVLVARVASAFSRALFWSLAAIVAVSLVSENRRGWAISIVFAGISAANLLGIPLRL